MRRVCSTNWEHMNAYTVLVGKPKRRRLLRRYRCRWKDNIKINLREIE
jgi:hypothetical protein